MPLISLNRRSKGNKEALLQRLQKCIEQPGNATCADCGDEKSVWASLLQCQTRKGGVSMGVFCCKKCCNYHYDLRRDICTVKNIKVADDWTEEEVRAIETSGNTLANAIYEAAGVHSRKAALLKMSGRAEEDAREEFATDKYRERKSFDSDAYQKHVIWSEVYKHATVAQRREHQDEIESMTGVKRQSVIPVEPKAPTITEPTATVLSKQDPSLADSSGVLDLGYDDEEDQAELARALAQRAICSGGAMRRGSFNGGLMNRGVNTGIDDSQRSARRRPRRTKSNDASATPLQRRNSNRSLHVEAESDCESEAEAVHGIGRGIYRSGRRCKSSDLAETEETRFQRRNSNRSLLLEDDTECESEAESACENRKVIKRRSRRTSSSDKAENIRLQRRNSRRSLLGGEDTLETGEERLQRKNSRRNLLEKSGSDRSLHIGGEEKIPQRKNYTRRNLLEKRDSDRSLHIGGEEKRLQRKNSRRNLLERLDSDRALKIAQDKEDAEYQTDAESVCEDRKARRRSRHNLSSDTAENTQLQRRHSRRSLLGREEKVETGDKRLQRKNSRRHLLDKRDPKVATDKEGPAEPIPRRSPVTKQDSRVSNSAKSPVYHTSSDCGDQVDADHKARRRSGRRRTKCESPTSVQDTDSAGSGSGSRPSEISAGSSGTRPRRRPSLNGALAFAMPNAPTLS